MPMRGCSEVEQRRRVMRSLARANWSVLNNPNPGYLTSFLKQCTRKVVPFGQ